jgi:hypothetical protein
MLHAQELMTDSHTDAVAKLTTHAFKLLPMVSQATTNANASQCTQSDADMLLLSSGFTMKHMLCGRSAWFHQHMEVHCMPRETAGANACTASCYDQAMTMHTHQH